MVPGAKGNGRKVRSHGKIEGDKNISSKGK
jgi:hypothetical protein